MSYFIARKKSNLVVTARLLLQDEIVESREGPTKAKAGDYEITGVQGEKYAITADYLNENYLIVGKQPEGDDLVVSPRGVERAVYETDEDMIVRGKHGNFKGKAGDYVVQYAPDDFAICDRGIFGESYDILRPARIDEKFPIPKS